MGKWKQCIVCGAMFLYGISPAVYFSSSKPHHEHTVEKTALAYWVEPNKSPFLPFESEHQPHTHNEGTPSHYQVTPIAASGTTIYDSSVAGSYNFSNNTYYDLLSKKS